MCENNIRLFWDLVYLEITLVDELCQWLRKIFFFAQILYRMVINGRKTCHNPDRKILFRRLHKFIQGHNITKFLIHNRPINICVPCMCQNRIKLNNL